MTNKKPKLQTPAAKNMQTKTLSHNGWAKKKRRKTKHAKNTNERINTSCLMKEKGGGAPKGEWLCVCNASAFNAICKCRASWARFYCVSAAFCARLLLHKFATQKGLGEVDGNFRPSPAIRNCRLPILSIFLNFPYALEIT